MALTVEVKNGKDMPSVNTFGGCDPFVEVRCVKDDPAKNPTTAIEGAAIDTGKTKQKSGDSNPTWDQTFTLSKAEYGKDKFINIVLWDSNVSKNLAIGYVPINTTDLLAGMQYDPAAVEPAKKDFTAKDFISVLPDKNVALTSVVNMSFSYLEVHKFKVSITKCSQLPKECIGQVLVEVRLVKGDPRQEYPKSPGKETLWSGKTKTINDNADPAFNEDLSFSFAADPALHLVVAVSSSGTPCAMVVTPMKQICSNALGETQQFTSKLEKAPNVFVDLSSATVDWSISHELEMGK